MTLLAAVCDEAAGQPIVTSRLVLAANTMALDVSEFEILLPGQQLDHIFLEMQVPGHEEWHPSFRHQLALGRLCPLLVELKRMPTKCASPRIWTQKPDP